MKFKGLVGWWLTGSEMIAENGTAHPCAVVEAVSKQKLRIKSAELLEAGDYKLVVKSGSTAVAEAQWYNADTRLVVVKDGERYEHNVTFVQA